MVKQKRVLAQIHDDRDSQIKHRRMIKHGDNVIAVILIKTKTRLEK